MATFGPKIIEQTKVSVAVIEPDEVKPVTKTQVETSNEQETINVVQTIDEINMSEEQLVPGRRNSKQEGLPKEISYDDVQRNETKIMGNNESIQFNQSNTDQVDPV
jgi:hypothetical protein